jgi:hypothetical protein
MTNEISPSSTAVMVRTSPMAHPVPAAALTSKRTTSFTAPMYEMVTGAA